MVEYLPSNTEEKMKKVTILLCLFFVLFFSFANLMCSKIRKEKDKFCSTVATSSKIELNDSVYYLIHDYINKYSQFNTFLLKVYSPNIDNTSGNNCSVGFLLGPFYEGILKKDENPMYYVTVANKQVFIMLGIESLIKTSKHQKDVIQKRIIPRGVDSLVISSDWIIKNGFELYINKAIYFSVQNEQLIINNRLDTFLIPQLKEIIDFKN